MSGDRAHELHHAPHLLGEVASHTDPLIVEAAESHCQQALALTEELGMRPLQAHCHLGLGSLYQRVGRRDEARAELATAIQMYRAIEMTFWLTRAEAQLAHRSH